MTQDPQDKDAKLRTAAALRVSFKIHATVYIAVISFIWFVYFMTGDEYPWAIWPTLGWGLAVLIHGLIAYGKSEFFSVDKEYEKLKNRR